MSQQEPLTPHAVIVGVPLDENSSFLRGPALAPARIRAALSSGSMNLCTEDGDDLGSRTEWRDAGDLEIGHGTAVMCGIERQIAALATEGARILSLGGDHSVTYPIVRALAAHYPTLTILHFDAHPDLYGDFDGNPYSHASPFARIMEERLARRLVQVGIRTMNPEQKAQAERFGVEVIPMRRFSRDLPLELEAPLYISLDLDVLDPAFAPGVSHHEPGGLSVRDVLDVLAGITVPVVGADIVEYNPVRDHGERTAMVAAKFYKELLGLLIR